MNASNNQILLQSFNSRNLLDRGQIGHQEVMLSPSKVLPGEDFLNDRVRPPFQLTAALHFLPLEIFHLHEVRVLASKG